MFKPLCFIVSNIIFRFGISYAQTVSDVRVTQEANQVVIRYHLNGFSESAIKVFLSKDSGKTYSEITSGLRGDVGKNIKSGLDKIIVWNVLESRENLFGDQLIFKIQAIKITSPTITNKLPKAIQSLLDNMVLVEGGTFTMGCTSEQGSDCYDDEKPAHRVALKRFRIAKYEVTQAQWKEVMATNPSYFKNCPNCPVETVSWRDVHQFIRKLNALTGKSFRLPTEAEWEFAARGGNQSRGYKYVGSDNKNEISWNDENSNSKTHPVGQKQANELGLHDMSGNVLEWCSDLWNGAYNTSSHQNSISRYSVRVARGGGWYSYARFLRVSYRNRYTQNSHYPNLGFRLVLPSD